MGEYIKPTQAYKKLDAAKLLRQSVYIYAATGYGKTELINQYFRNQKYIYIPCQQNFCDLSLIPDGYTDAVVIDNVNAIDDEEIRNSIVSLFSRKQIWLIIAGRSKMPSWLFDSFVKCNMMLITEEDLALTVEGIDRYMRSEGLILTEEELQYLKKCCEGNLFVVKYTAQLLLAGNKIGRELYESNLATFVRYLEDSDISALNTELVDFLMKVSVVEDFTEQLAVMITGNSAAHGLIERAMDAGNFIDKRNDVYTIRFQFREALRSKAVKEFQPGELRDYALLAGGYYEANNEDNKALNLYVKYNETGRIRELLLRNARKCPESGYYMEMRKYYLMLSEEAICSSVYLMSAMSLLYSMLLDFEKSEYWYKKLEQYRDTAKGQNKREATRQLAYLDIALPHLGSKNILELIKSCYTLLKDKSIPFPEFSVTSNQPSLMNGGKDFCDWSKHDREIAATAGKLVSTFLGKYGKGLANAALAESFFEKGGDPYEIISLVSKAKLEAESGGKPELCFAANAVLIRQHMISGSPDAAKSLLDSFEKTAKRENLNRILPTIGAMRCRIALMEGDSATVSDWLKTAPDEDEAFVALERYRYLTKIRCYIAGDEFGRAFSLIESLRYYAEKCDRKFISMELSILAAIIKYRSGSEWKKEFIPALEKICEYRFVPIISREGAAIFPLLTECRELCAADRNIDGKWFETVVEATGKVARRYPLYLKTDKARPADISPIDVRILACLAEGLSMPKTAERLNMNFETLRSRIKELYRRLGAKNKTEAVMIAREMKII